MGRSNPSSKPLVLSTTTAAQKPAKSVSKKSDPVTRRGSQHAGVRSVVYQDIPKPAQANMAASFLQFCAMCEKQIMTPCNNILYCSEACRRKDGCKPLSAAMLTQMKPPSSLSSSPTRVILLPRTPTGSYTDLPSVRIPSELHSSKSDLDPTEWKPKLSSRTPSSSEAFRFLSQFHRSAATSCNDTPPIIMSNDFKHPSGGETMVPASMPTTPSLTFSLASTPSAAISASNTSAGSSFGHGTARTSGVQAADGSGYFGNGHVSSAHNAGTYDFSSNTRALPLRHNRWYSVSGATPKGTDLVTPHIAPPVDMRTPDANDDVTDGLWEKKVVVPGTSVTNGTHGSASASAGGIKTLFQG